MDGILQLSQSLITIAEQTVLCSELEFNHLARSFSEEDSIDEKRFYFLRWEREALRSFVENSTSAYQDLLNEAQNVWETRDYEQVADNSTVTTASNETPGASSYMTEDPRGPEYKTG